MTSVKVAARPAVFGFDPRKSVLIVVDMQNDFGAEGGMFHRAGIDIAPIREIVPRIAGVVAECRNAGISVVFLRQQHDPELRNAGGPDTPHFIKHQRMQLGKHFPAPDDTTGRVLVRGTWNTENVQELMPQSGDLVVGKHRYSGFFETDLHERLQELGAEVLIFVGATTSICVESTVRDAMFRDYRCLVLEDCTAEPIAFGAPRTNHEASLLNIELLFGWVATSKDLRAALQPRAEAAE